LGSAVAFLGIARSIQQLTTNKQRLKCLEPVLYCGATQQTEGRFCAFCGTELPSDGAPSLNQTININVNASPGHATRALTTCPLCEERVSTNAAECPHCGTSLVDEDAREAADAIRGLKEIAKAFSDEPDDDPDSSSSSFPLMGCAFILAIIFVLFMLVHQMRLNM
jgi:hypothetical protein